MLLISLYAYDLHLITLKIPPRETYNGNKDENVSDHKDIQKKRGSIPSFIKNENYIIVLFLKGDFSLPRVHSSLQKLLMAFTSDDLWLSFSI